MFKPSSREIPIEKPQRCYLLMYKITMLAVMVGNMSGCRQPN